MPIGNFLIRFPVSAKIALHTAGAMGGVPGSPTPCFTVQRGYEPGFRLAATASGALGLQVSSELRVFTEARMHVPSGIGRSGFAQDPHAAFVELAFGVTLLR